MPSAKDVNPSDFTVQHVLLDDGIFSMVWGTFDHSTKKKSCVGVRWNGTGRLPGYPNAKGQHSTWFVMPRWLAMAFLPQVLQLEGAHVAAIRTALRRLKKLDEY